MQLSLKPLMVNKRCTWLSNIQLKAISNLKISETPDTYVVTWSTLNFTLTEAHFGTLQSFLYANVTGTSFIFEDGGQEKRRQYIHVVKLQPLEPDTQYCKITNGFLQLTKLSKEHLGWNLKFCLSLHHLENYLDTSLLSWQPKYVQF